MGQGLLSFSSSSGAVPPLSLSSRALGMKKQSKSAGSESLLLLRRTELPSCYALEFWRLFASRERFPGKMGDAEAFLSCSPTLFVLLSGRTQSPLFG